MKKIIYLIFVLIFVACSNNLKNEFSESNMDLNNLAKDENRFFLFEGSLLNMENKIKLYLTTDDLRDSGINLHGQFYDLSSEMKFSVDGFIKDNKIYLRFNPIESSENNRPSFEGNILDDGIIEGQFINDLIYKDAKAIFRLLTNLSFVTIAKEFKIKKKDEGEFNILLKEQGGLTNNPKINKIIGSGTNNINELRNAISTKLSIQESKLKIDSNYENIFIMNVDYMDNNFIGFSNYSYTYDGGAHGISHENYDFYSLKTGEKLNNSLDFLLKDKNEQKLRGMILDAFSKNNFHPLNGENFNYLDLASFKINDLGVEFFWNVYEIAPYSEGVIRIQFSFRDLKPYIKEDSPYYVLF